MRSGGRIGRDFTRALLRGYRIAIAPAIGPVCRYSPTCSVYAEEAVERWGVVRGGTMALFRVLRCHPFARGGLDPVPTAWGARRLCQRRAWRTIAGGFGEAERSERGGGGRGGPKGGANPPRVPMSDGRDR